MNLEEFLSTDEINLSSNLKNFKKEIKLIQELDDIYQKYLDYVNKIKINPSNEESVIIILIRNIHYHFYFTISCYLRLHMEDAFISLRKAIDSALTVYYIIEYPESVYNYLDEKNNKDFVYMIKTIQKDREQNPNHFPLAPELIELHKKCSQYSGHADFQSFVYRIKMSNNSKKEINKMNFGYITFFKDEIEFLFYFFIILVTFMNIFKIIQIFFKRKIKIDLPTLENRLLNLDKSVKKEYQSLKKECIK